MPMGAARRHREDRRDRQKIGTGLGERTIEVRQGHIVATAHAEAAPRRLGDDSAAAGPVRVALAVALAAGEVDIEHMYLVVARDDGTARIDKERTIAHPRLL